MLAAHSLVADSPAPAGSSTGLAAHRLAGHKAAGHSRLEARVAHSRKVAQAGRTHWAGQVVHRLAVHSHWVERVVHIAPAHIDRRERMDLVAEVRNPKAARHCRTRHNCHIRHRGFLAAGVERSRQLSLGRCFGVDIHSHPARPMPLWGLARTHSEGTAPDSADRWDSHTKGSASCVLQRNTHPVWSLHLASVQDDA
jgi:hypothetical protein